MPPVVATSPLLPASRLSLDEWAAWVMSEIAGAEPGSLLLLPELLNLPLLDPAQPALAALGRLATDSGLYLGFSLAETAQGRLVNAGYLLAADGETLLRYEKVSPTTEEREAGLTAGTVEPPIVPTPWGPTKMLVCADAFDPRRAVQGGPALILIPSANPQGWNEPERGSGDRLQRTVFERLVSRLHDGGRRAVALSMLRGSTAGQSFDGRAVAASTQRVDVRTLGLAG